MQLVLCAVDWNVTQVHQCTLYVHRLSFIYCKCEKKTKVCDDLEKEENQRKKDEKKNPVFG